jgi:hypothetical protein
MKKKIMANKKKAVPTPAPAPSTPITYVQVPAADWHVQVVSSPCGTVHLRWDAQPNAKGYYVHDMTPRTSPCPALTTTTNELFYTLGSGCYWWPNHTYEVTVKYTHKDEATNTIYAYKSLPITLTTGPFYFDC